MADIWATKNGNWSDTTVWNTSALPTIADDVWANNKTVTINTNPAVLSVRTTALAASGIAAGGGFTVSNGVSLTALSIIAGSTTVLSFGGASPNYCTIFGNVSGSSTTGNIRVIANTSTGTLNVVGNLLCSSVFNGGALQNGAACILNNSSGTVNLTGDIYPGNQGNSGILNYASGTVNSFGNLAAQSYRGTANLYNYSNGTINHFGIGVGGVGANALVDSNAIFNNSSGTINLSGTITGGSVGYGINNASTGPVNINGTVTGGSGGYGIYNASTAVISVTGTSVGGTGSAGIYNNSTGRVYVYGSAMGGVGSGTTGVVNAANGYVYVIRTVGNGWGLGSTGISGGAAGLSNSQNGLAYVEEVEFGSRGQTPISGPVYIVPKSTNTLTGRLTALGGTVTFYNSLSAPGLLPPVSSVRLGEVFANGNLTGTMAVPSASAVQAGVPVNDTLGIAALTPQDVWGYARLSATEVSSMGERLKNCATTQSVGYQIASFNL